MPEAPESSLVVVGLLLLALVLAGPTWGESRDLGEGTADVTIVAPDGLEAGRGPADLTLRTSPGRFGAAAVYLRIPDLVVDVTDLDGRPRVVYQVTVPALDVDRQEHRVITDAGRLTIPMPDRAYPPADYPHDVTTRPSAGTYEGRLLVRVQSFTADRTVANRTVTVVVDP